MTDSLPINEVVRRTGLTSRTLRFYETKGLVAPLRTASGRRIFGARELSRLHQIAGDLSLSVDSDRATHQVSEVDAMPRPRKRQLDPMMRQALAA